MQVSWSPIARWIRAAATEESTPPVFIFDCGIGRVLGSADGTKSGRKGSHLVSMTVPDLKFRRQALEEIRLADDLNAPSAIFAAIGKFNRATKMKGHELNAIADAKNRNPKRKNRRV